MATVANGVAGGEDLPSRERNITGRAEQQHTKTAHKEQTGTEEWNSNGETERVQTEATERGLRRERETGQRTGTPVSQQRGRPECYNMTQRQWQSSSHSGMSLPIAELCALSSVTGGVCSRVSPVVGRTGS